MGQPTGHIQLLIYEYSITAFFFKRSNDRTFKKYIFVHTRFDEKISIVQFHY